MFNTENPCEIVLKVPVKLNCLIEFYQIKEGFTDKQEFLISIIKQYIESQNEVK